MKIDPRIPELVQPIFKDYLRLTEQRLIGLIDASYVVGSIALGSLMSISAILILLPFLVARPHL